MSYEIQEINSCTKKIVFNFPDVDLSKQIGEALKEKQKSANLKGFRKGKAPLSVVQQIYGAQVENDALYRFVSEEFYKAIQKEEIKAIGYPTFGNTKYEDGKNVEFEATVEIFPEITLNDYSSFEFKKESEEVSEEDIDKIQKSYLDSKVEMKEVTDTDATIEKGKTAFFNFEGEKADGTKPDNMKANDFQLEIGSGQFIPGFEDGMIGMKKDEKKTIEVTFPADYHEEDLRSAPVKFHVELLEIKEKSYPELSDELAKEFGFESVDDFKTKTKDNLVNQKKREVQTKLHEQILEKLVQENTFDIPNALVDQQKKGVQDDLANNLKQQGFDDNMIKQYFEKWTDDVTAKAEFQVKSGLILDTLAKSFEVEATEADLDAKIDEMAGQSGMDKKQIEDYYKGNEQIKNNIMYAIREEKTFDTLIGKMKVS